MSTVTDDYSRRTYRVRWAKNGAGVLLFISFSDFCQTNYLNIYRTDLREICTIGRTFAVDERTEVIFFDSSRDVAVATNFVDRIDLVVRMTFARAATSAYDKEGSD